MNNFPRRGERAVTNRVEVDKDCETTVEWDGELLDVGFVRVSVFERELYGEDADGRRGVGRWSILEDDFVDVVVDGWMLDQWKRAEPESFEVFKARVVWAIEDYLDKNPPTVEIPEREWERSED